VIKIIRQNTQNQPFARKTMEVDEAIALDSIQAIAASFGASFDAEKIVDTVVEKVCDYFICLLWLECRRSSTYS